MTRGTCDVLEAARLQALCRGVCLYAGLPLPPATAPGERFIVRSGQERPDFLARLLTEAFIEDGIEVQASSAEDLVDLLAPGQAKVIVRPGFAAPCPVADELGQAIGASGPVVLFAVERVDQAGKLLGVTWAAVPEEEPAPQGRFRAAVWSCESPPENPCD